MKKIKKQKPALNYLDRKYNVNLSDDYKTPVFLPLDIEYMNEYPSNCSLRTITKKYDRKSIPLRNKLNLF